MITEKFKYDFKSFNKSGSGFINFYYSPKYENYDLEHESGHNPSFDPELSQMILKCCSIYSEIEKTHIISENETVTIKRVELVTKEKAKGLFNRFSDMPRQQIIELITKASNPTSAAEASELAEMARALFINCAYVASVENSKLKNSEMCYFYSKSISEVYQNK